MIKLLSAIDYPKSEQKNSTQHAANMYVKERVHSFHMDLMKFKNEHEGIALFEVTGEVFNQGNLVEVLEFNIKKPEGLSDLLKDFVDNHDINFLKSGRIFD